MTVTSNVHYGLTAWASGVAVAVGARRSSNGQAWQASTAGTTGATAPSGTTGMSDGAVTWTWLSAIDYASLAAWYAALPSPLPSPVVAQVWNNGEVALAGWVLQMGGTSKSSTVNTLTIRPAPGEGFADYLRANPSAPLAYRATQGVAFVASGSYGGISIDAEIGVIIDGLQFRAAAPLTYIAAFVMGTAAGKTVTVRNCIFDYVASADSRSPGPVGASYTTNFVVYDCVFIDRQASGGVSPSIIQGYGTSVFENCTIAAVNSPAAATGFYSGANHPTLRNCIITGFGVPAAASASGYAVTTVNCLCSAGAMGANVNDTGSLFGRAASAQFVDPAANFRLVQSSAAKGAGAAPTLAALDILGTAIQDIRRDIGAYELPHVYAPQPAKVNWLWSFDYTAGAVGWPVPPGGYVSALAAAEQARIASIGEAAFPAQWGWADAGVAQPRAATPADGLTPRIEQWRGGVLVRTWGSFASVATAHASGGDSAGSPFDVDGFAATGGGPFGNVSHVDTYRCWRDGDVFLVYPAVYTGTSNYVVVQPRQDYYQEPASHVPDSIVIRGVTVDGIRPVIYRADGGAGDALSSQGPVYFGACSNVLFENIDVACDPLGHLGKGGIYINGAANLTLRNCRVRDFAKVATGYLGQNGVFGTTANSGTLLIEQLEVFNNGSNDGPAHNFYLGMSIVDPSFTVHMVGVYSHDSVFGHTFKSRAQVNVIEGCYFRGGRPNAYLGFTQADNYLLDVPNAGVLVVRNSIFAKDASGINSNGMSLTYGMEGITDSRALSALVENNTFVAFCKTFDGSHPVYPFGFRLGSCPGSSDFATNYPNIGDVTYRNNAFVGYVPQGVAADDYRGTYQAVLAFAEIGPDYAVKMPRTGSGSVAGTPSYAHAAAPAGARIGSTVGARDWVSV